MGIEDVTRSDIPRDRLGRIASQMLEALERHPEASGSERAIVMLFDSKDALTALTGYDEDPDLTASVDLFMHLSALFKAQGKTLQLLSDEGVTLL